jgi:hypothetical protein
VHTLAQIDSVAALSRSFQKSAQRAAPTKHSIIC